jgi:DNA-binding transcriptional LysR family regulator
LLLGIAACPSCPARPGNPIRPRFNSRLIEQIRQLSRDVGVPLLEPHGRRVRLTAAAHVLLDHADALYVRWEAAKAELAAHVEGAAGPLRLCGFPSGLAGLLAPAAARLPRPTPTSRSR